MPHFANRWHKHQKLCSSLQRHAPSCCFQETFQNKLQNDILMMSEHVMLQNQALPSDCKNIINLLFEHNASNLYQDDLHHLHPSVVMLWHQWDWPGHEMSVYIFILLRNGEYWKIDFCIIGWLTVKPPMIWTLLYDV